MTQPTACVTARRGARADRAIPAGGGILPAAGVRGGLGRWGALQGGLGVCIIVASAAIGAIVTMVARSAPGFLLGLFVVAGTVAAALAVRPRTGWMIFPVPVLSYLVAALTKRGRIRPVRRFVQDGAGHRRGAVDRRRLLRDGARHRAGRRDHRRPLVSLAPPQADPARPGLAGPAGWPHQDWPGRTARQDGPRQDRNGPGWGGTRRRTARPPRAGLGDLDGIRVSPAGFAGPGSRGREARPSLGGPGVPGSGVIRARAAPALVPPPSRIRTLQLLQRGVTEHQVLDAVVAAEVDLRLGLVAVAVGRHHGAEPELVVVHHVPG